MVHRWLATILNEVWPLVMTSLGQNSKCTELWPNAERWESNLLPHETPEWRHRRGTLGVPEWRLVMLSQAATRQVPTYDRPLKTGTSMRVLIRSFLVRAYVQSWFLSFNQLVTSRLLAVSITPWKLGHRCNKRTPAEIHKAFAWILAIKGIFQDLGSWCSTVLLQVPHDIATIVTSHWGWSSTVRIRCNGETNPLQCIHSMAISITSGYRLRARFILSFLWFNWQRRWLRHPWHPCIYRILGQVPHSRPANNRFRNSYHHLRTTHKPPLGSLRAARAAQAQWCWLLSPFGALLFLKLTSPLLE